MNSENEQKQSPELKPAIRMLSWFTVCYLFSLVNYLGTSQGLWFWFVSFRWPTVTAPTWMMTPMWTVLYGLLAWGAWDIWTAPPDDDRTKALVSFFSQLTLNAVWPWLYFDRHMIVPSLIAIALVFVASITTAVFFTRIKPRSGYLAIPFLTWVGYLTILYIVIWRMNR
jgi:tryptophan-rich sensory protein